MISPDDNDLLTRVGPGTPMGNLMREFWVPACLSRELVAGKAPLRLMILGEKLVGFRDSEGRVGVLDHRCPHRCASLFFGRNEEGGLRCVYHGWKFDVEGNCLDMPNVPPKFEFSPRVKAKAYPTAERHGIVYIYMGTAEQLPPLPCIDALLVDEGISFVSCSMRECSYLQAIEGDLDTSHFGFLHLGSVKDEDVDPEYLHSATVLNRAPEYFCKDTDWGTMYCGYREAPDASQLYYRFSHFHFPFWTQFPDGNFEDNIVASAAVPIDDTHTMMFFAMYTEREDPIRRLKDGRPVPGLERDAEHLGPELLPNGSGWYDRWRPVQRASNDYLISRDAQARDNYSGIETVFTQDTAMVESMGGIVDRTWEHLAPSDIMITRTRRRLIKAAREFEETGKLPDLAVNPALSRGARSGAFLAPKEADWMAAYHDACAAAIDPIED